MSLMQPAQPEWSEAHAVLDMADLVRREGHRVYAAAGMEEGIYQSALCGLSVSFQRGGVVQSMKSHDMEIHIRLVETAIEQDDGIERNSPVKMMACIDYVKGTATTLAAWHRHLCAYRQSIRVFTRETVTA